MNELAKFLLAGDDDSAWAIIVKEHEKGKSSLTIFQDLITKSLQYIGELWQKNIITVADEHLATTTCDYILSKYQWMIGKNNKIPPYPPKKVMLLCLENEFHFIGLKMVAILFEEHGWNVKFLGANMPLEHAKLAIEKWDPHVVCLSFSLVHHAQSLLCYVKEIKATTCNPEILIGGRLVGEYNFAPQLQERVQKISNLNGFKEWLDTEETGGSRFVKS